MLPMTTARRFSNLVLSLNSSSSSRPFLHRIGLRLSANRRFYCGAWTWFLATIGAGTAGDCGCAIDRPAQLAMSDAPPRAARIAAEERSLVMSRLLETSRARAAPVLERTLSAARPPVKSTTRRTVLSAREAGNAEAAWRRQCGQGRTCSAPREPVAKFLTSARAGWRGCQPGTLPARAASSTV